MPRFPIVSRPPPRSYFDSLSRRASHAHSYSECSTSSDSSSHTSSQSHASVASSTSLYPSQHIDEVTKSPPEQIEPFSQVEDHLTKTATELKSLCNNWLPSHLTRLIAILHEQNILPELCPEAGNIVSVLKSSIDRAAKLTLELSRVARAHNKDITDRYSRNAGTEQEASVLRQENTRLASERDEACKEVQRLKPFESELSELKISYDCKEVEIADHLFKHYAMREKWEQQRDSLESEVDGLKEACKRKDDNMRQLQSARLRQSTSGERQSAAPSLYATSPHVHTTRFDRQTTFSHGPTTSEHGSTSPSRGSTTSSRNFATASAGPDTMVSIVRRGCKANYRASPCRSPIAALVHLSLDNTKLQFNFQVGGVQRIRSIDVCEAVSGSHFSSQGRMPDQIRTIFIQGPCYELELLPSTGEVFDAWASTLLAASKLIPRSLPESRALY